MDSAAATTSEKYGDEGTPRVRWWTRHADVLILAALGAFAVTQPLLADFREGAGYFVARRAGPVEIVLLVLALTAVPGVLAGLLLWTAGKVSLRARTVVMTALVGIFVSLALYLALIRLGWIPTPVVVFVSVSIGLFGALRFGKGKWLRSFLMFLIPAPLVFALFFLVTPPVFSLVAPRGVPVFDAGAESEAPIVFVVLDEFPAVSLLNAQGGIDSSRYPGFARLASLSTWYKYTAAAHDNTLWAVPALLSGQVPEPSHLPTVSNYPGNLFTFLHDSHEMHVVETFTNLCPQDLCESNSERAPTLERLNSLLSDAALLYWLSLQPDEDVSPSISDPFEEFQERAANRISRESVTDQVTRFSNFLSGISSSAPQLHFMHLFLPHAPYRYYPSGRHYNAGGELNGLEEEVWVDPVLARQGYQRHLLQVERVDDLIGDLLAQLESVGALDESLLVITADHGASFRVGESRRRISDGNAYEVGLVPLFIKAPRQNRGSVDLSPARTVDVLPTIASHLGLNVPWVHEGRILEPGRPTASEPPVVRSVAGGEVVLDDVVVGLDEATDYLSSLFAVPGGDIDVYAAGGYESLIGLPLEDMAVDGSSLSGHVDEVWRFAHVAPYTGFVPGFIHGYVSGHVQDDSYVGVAVNGRLHAIAPVHGVEEGRVRFNAIIPDHAFTSGFNDLRLLAVSGAPQRPHLAEIAIAGNVLYEIDSDGEGGVVRVIAENGDSWPLVTDESIVGSVDSAFWREPTTDGENSIELELHGWAVDKFMMEPARHVVFFVGGVYAGSANLNIERADIQEVYGDPGLRTSGFIGRLPEFFPAEDLSVRAFALSSGYSAELAVTDSAQAAIWAAHSDS